MPSLGLTRRHSRYVIGVEIAAEAARLERFASDHATQGFIEIYLLLPRITITAQVQRLKVALGSFTDGRRRARGR